MATKPEPPAPHGLGDSLVERLHAIQQQHGYLPREALQRLARAMARPLSEVMGVASFYHLFRLVPPGLHRCVVCRGTACFVRGAERLEATLRQRGVAFETASCVGACGQAPVLVLDGRVGSGDPGELPWL
ncbi:MAG: NAD(P)H-dependent oxidoreductase subunit E [Cyanobium sp. LacPavin_0818_WC50_MAG_67_9]|nr:NAD(P)H-dependent oxidoreductase subunit E [Cyanobium sp. LacPavin_0818_WC50_MAG_67_9]